MSNERVKGGFQFTCDCCGQFWEPPRLGVGSAPREFIECWEMAKEEGWRATKVVSRATGKEDWEHRCPECA